MKQLFTLCFFLGALSAVAQMKVLFVDDSDDTFLNAESVHMAIEASGFEAHYFDALDSFDLLTTEYLSGYDLVVWQTSNDGTQLGLWNKNDTENSNLKAYLNQGGKLWIGGLDFLFDKYGTAPKTFAEGEFVYDYMGIDTYDVQTYGDDGNQGVPIVNPEDSCHIEGLVPIKWNFTTLWWVDGVTPREGSHVIYRMGGDNYVFNGKICGVLYSKPDFEVLSCFFDLGVAFDFETMKASVKPVMDYFKSKISSSKDESFKNDIHIYPNPTEEPFVWIENLEHLGSNLKIRLLDMNGSLISETSEVVLDTNNKRIKVDLPTWGNTQLYVIQLTSNDKVFKRLIVKLRN